MKTIDFCFSGVIGSAAMLLLAYSPAIAATTPSAVVGLAAATPQRLAQYGESVEERHRELEQQGQEAEGHAHEGDARQRGLEQPNQRNVEDPDARQEDDEQGDERQREVEGRD
jgi:hypothetical protein